MIVIFDHLLERISRESRNSLPKLHLLAAWDASDCAGWTWKNCPKAVQDVMVGKDGVPTLRIEVICDLNLWV